MSQNQPIVLIGSSIMNDQIKQIAGFGAFILACMFLAFLAGMLTGVFKVFPFPAVENMAVQVYKATKGEPDKGRLHFMYRKRNADVGTTVHEPAAVQAGVTLVSGMWLDDGKWRPSARLIDFDGAILHEWKIRPEQIWPESPHTDLAAGSHNKPTSYVHGIVLLPNGDIVFNIEYLGMVRLDSCGDVVWKLPYRTHHSISLDGDGNIWASGTVWREQKNPAYVEIKPPFVDETMVQVSPDGEILQEIFILQSLVESGYQGTIKRSHKTLDLTHMNDVEVLHADMAEAFPMFEAGDILVSLRNLNTVVVVDGTTRQVKWHFSHPMIHQHDPDFEADGTITIFDNNDDTTRNGDYWGRSRIIKVDPETYRWDVVYPTSDDQLFYSQEGGKHQLLENGNRLITEANAGRAFEIKPDGTIVWNWVIASDDPDFLPEVLEATRYPDAYRAIAVCAQP
jgi:hypothetical protein